MSILLMGQLVFCYVFMSCIHSPVYANFQPFDCWIELSASEYDPTIEIVFGTQFPPSQSMHWQWNCTTPTNTTPHPSVYSKLQSAVLSSHETLCIVYYCIHPQLHGTSATSLFQLVGCYQRFIDGVKNGHDDDIAGDWSPNEGYGGIFWWICDGQEGRIAHGIWAVGRWMPLLDGSVLKRLQQQQQQQQNSCGKYVEGGYCVSKRHSKSRAEERCWSIPERKSHRQLFPLSLIPIKSWFSSIFWGDPGKAPRCK